MGWALRSRRQNALGVGFCGILLPAAPLIGGILRTDIDRDAAHRLVVPEHSPGGAGFSGLWRGRLNGREGCGDRGLGRRDASSHRGGTAGLIVEERRPSPTVRCGVENASSISESPFLPCHLADSFLNPLEPFEGRATGARRAGIDEGSSAAGRPVEAVVLSGERLPQGLQSIVHFPTLDHQFHQNLYGLDNRAYVPIHPLLSPTDSYHNSKIQIMLNHHQITMCM